MNIELFEKVKARIKEEPEHFHMANWFIQINGDNLPPPYCDTTFCIGGWAALESGMAKGISTLPRHESVYKTLLQTPNTSIFHVADWPSLYGGIYYSLRAKHDHIAIADLACEVIDNYIQTDGWTK